MRMDSAAFDYVKLLVAFAYLSEAEADELVLRAQAQADAEGSDRVTAEHIRRVTAVDLFSRAESGRHTAEVARDWGVLLS